jgi:hypothetical protein
MKPFSGQFASLPPLRERRTGELTSHTSLPVTPEGDQRTGKLNRINVFRRKTLIQFAARIQFATWPRREAQKEPTGGTENNHPRAKEARCMQTLIRTRPLMPPVKPKANGTAEAPKENKPRIEPDTSFFLCAIADGKPILATLKSGRCHIGKVTRFGLYTVEIQTEADGLIVLFKSALESMQWAS